MTSIAIPLYPGVDLLDVAGPFEMLDWAGFAITLLAPRPGPLPCRGGAPVFDVATGYADAGRYDVLWVPGGDPNSLSCLIDDPAGTYLNLIASLSARATLTCSVCEGALLLAAAGLLDGYRATTHWAFLPCLRAYPAVRVARGHPRFVHDRDRLTGGGISSGLDEALKLIEIVMGKEVAVETQRVTQYYPRPPVKSRITPATSCPMPAPGSVACGGITGQGAET